jgi:excinuclease ABC subunit C
MKDRLGSVLYVGKAKDLKRRVSSYFQPSSRQRIGQPKVAAMVSLVHDVDTLNVASEAEALLLEGRLIKQYRPKYNTDFTDNKQFLLVRVTMPEPLPRFRLTRNRKEDGARYFGPFAQAGQLRKTLSQMRLSFGILLGDGKPVQQADGKWLLYDDCRAEIYGQPEPVAQAQYRERVQAACAFLEGKSKQWLADLEAKMHAAAQAQEFERAAQLRDTLTAMQATAETATASTRKFTGLGDPVKALQQDISRIDDLKSLAGYLQMRRMPRHMECFDISHISGEHVVASMVCFKEGEPSRSDYRRFRIRSFVGNDDYRAMEEVVGRRYRRLATEQRPMPDLIVIDGGLGQVRAALKAFEQASVQPPMLIGLAKREETIVFADERAPLNLPPHNRALRLLQQIRDEAHRFANAYSDELRRRKIRESVLLDMPGLGQKRRDLLLEHFGSLQKLKLASVEEIAELEGFGPKMAERLCHFLRVKALA